MQLLRLTENNRSKGYTRADLRQDVLYGYCRLREVSVSASRKERIATRVTDGMADQMLAWGLITPAQKEHYEQVLLKDLLHIDRFDHYPSEELYAHISTVRQSALGRASTDAYLRQQALEGFCFSPDGIDQQAKKDALLENCQALIFCLTEAQFMNLMLEDIQKATKKEVWVLCDPALHSLLPDCCRLLEAIDGNILYDQRLQEYIDSGNACLFFYGEDGLTACRGLLTDAVVHAVPAGYFAQAVTGLWSGEGCITYVPKGMDITRYVPLTQKTRLNFSILCRLWQDHGESIYDLNLQQLYRHFPEYFVNVYDGKPSGLPLSIEADTLSDFDKQLDEGLSSYLSGFPNAEYQSAYFDEALSRQPICYNSAHNQPGILVQTVKIKKADGAQVISCEKGKTPRQMFEKLQLPGVGIVSNFLFFMTPKLGILYNDLRSDRPPEQADAASGHLDYMKLGSTETFPLFSKACVAMKEDGRFLFFNYHLGGGSVSISGFDVRWEKEAVNADNAPIRVYTPFYSAADKDADRNTYRKAVGADRVNIILLRDKVTCIRKGDVLLPSVGVVLSLTEELAKPLLQKCKPLADGYYDVSGLTLTVHLDPPEGIDPQDWASVQWAYGGGLTLIRDGVGLCDGEHMEAWFDTEGWTSPLSRQTQESNLHSLVKHPRTAIGCTADGSLVVLVYSGRTWRSTGADYREMIAIARQLYPDIHFLMNCDGGGSAMLGMVQNGSFLELSFPSTSSGSCAGQVRPVNTVFYMPIQEKGESQ